MPHYILEICGKFLTIFSIIISRELRPDQLARFHNCKEETWEKWCFLMISHKKCGQNIQLSYGIKHFIRISNIDAVCKLLGYKSKMLFGNRESQSFWVNFKHFSFLINTWMELNFHLLKIKFGISNNNR